MKLDGAYKKILEEENNVLNSFVVNITKAFVSEKDKVPTIHFLDTVMEIKCSFIIDKPEYVNSFEDEKKSRR